MSRTTKPRLGEMVRFTRSLEKWPSSKYEEANEEEQATIPARFEPNPNPDLPAMVVGVVSKSIEAKFVPGSDHWEDPGRYSWGHGPRKTFYVLKRSIRGKRFLVALEDMIREGGGAA